MWYQFQKCNLRTRYLSSLGRLAKLLSGECLGTILMTSQHWFKYWLGAVIKFLRQCWPRSIPCGVTRPGCFQIIRIAPRCTRGKHIQNALLPFARQYIQGHFCYQECNAMSQHARIVTIFSPKEDIIDLEQCRSKCWNTNICAHLLQTGALWGICQMHCGVCETVDLSHKSHNASDKYTTMHRFVSM